jgi:hypothetical protein
MPQDQKQDPTNRSDDPRQAIEEGDPQITGRSRGRVADEDDAAGASRTDPDASPDKGKKDVSATTPHRESGDR